MQIHGTNEKTQIAQRNPYEKPKQRSTILNRLSDNITKLITENIILEQQAYGLNGTEAENPKKSTLMGQSALSKECKGKYIVHIKDGLLVNGLLDSPCKSTKLIF